jgi:hypothetical protein
MGVVQFGGEVNSGYSELSTQVESRRATRPLPVPDDGSGFVPVQGVAG